MALTATIVTESDGVCAGEIIAGGQESLTWAEYLDLWTTDGKPRILAIRQAIEHAGLVGTKADRFCNDHFFALSDGTQVGFTWRGWGDLMSAIVGKREGYMTYYC